MPGDEPKTQHIWMTDGRTLCDRRAATHTDIYSMSDSEYDEWITEQTEAPACGSCLLLASRLRREASALLIESRGQVWPEKPTDAWRLMRDTRWGGDVDIDSFLKRDDLDRIRFDAVNDAVDPESVNQLVREHAIAQNAALRRYTEARAKSKASKADTPTTPDDGAEKVKRPSPRRRQRTEASTTPHP